MGLFGQDVVHRQVLVITSQEVSPVYTQTQQVLSLSSLKLALAEIFAFIWYFFFNKKLIFKTVNCRAEIIYIWKLLLRKLFKCINPGFSISKPVKAFNAW